MTKGFTVVLEQDLKDEYAEYIANAIRQFRGVLQVTPIESSPNDMITEMRVKHEYWEKIREVLK